MGIRHEIVSREKLIDSGFIACNHRSYFDFAIDPLVGKGVIIGRIGAFLAVFFSSLLGLINNRILFFRRGATKRGVVYDKIIGHRCKFGKSFRVIFYPEGTRKNHLKLESVEDVKNHFRYGLLKSIYEDGKYPVQVIITTNKELVFNEKMMEASWGVNVKTVIGRVIRVEEYGTFEEFVEALAKEWYECWNN